MTDEENKEWGNLLEIAKRNLSLPIMDKQFRAAQQVFIAATAELTRLREDSGRLRAAEIWLKATGAYVQGGVGIPFCVSWTGLDETHYGNNLVDAVLSAKEAELRRRAGG